VKAKEFLSQRHVPYIVKDVSQDRQAAMEMIRLSGQQGVPVINVDGQVVVGFNRPRLEQLLAGRTASASRPRRSLGAMVGDAADQARRRPGVPLVGAYVGGVRPGSAAEQAGLHAGDVITAVGGQPVRDAADLERALNVDGAGGRLRIEYIRDGTAHQAEALI